MYLSLNNPPNASINFQKKPAILTLSSSGYCMPYFRIFPTIANQAKATNGLVVLVVSSNVTTLNSLAYLIMGPEGLVRIPLTTLSANCSKCSNIRVASPTHSTRSYLHLGLLHIECVLESR